MSNYVITKNSTQEERMQAIREAAERFEKIKARRARLAASAARVVRYVDEVDKPERKKFDDMISKMDENHNHYQDAPQYAEKYYGEKMRDTVAMDNDWN
jgi:hypothetical protein